MLLNSLFKANRLVSGKQLLSVHSNSGFYLMLLGALLIVYFLCAF